MSDAKPSKRGTFTPAEPATPLPEMLARSLAPGGALDRERMPGQLPGEAGNPPPSLASFTDLSPEKPADPGLAASSSPPAPMETLPHLRGRKNG